MGWLGFNLCETRDTASGRWSANWAHFGRRWVRPDGSAAGVSANLFPQERASSVVINGNYARPTVGEWTVKWTPKETGVTLRGPGVDGVCESAPGLSTYRMESTGNVRVDASGALTSLLLIPPGHEKRVFWDGFFDPIDNLDVAVLRDLDLRATNYTTPDADPDARRLWTPKWSERPRYTDCHFTTKRGVPAGVEAAITNRLGVEYLWVCIPAHAGEDYVRGLMRVFLRTLKENTVLIVEYSNEIWNQIFPIHKHYRDLGRTHVPELAGLDAAAVFEWVLDVWPSDRVRCVVMGHQSDVSFARRMAKSVSDAGQRVDGVGCALYMPPLPLHVADWKDRYRADQTVPTATEVGEAVRCSLEDRLPSQAASHRQLADDLSAELLYYEGGVSLYNPGPFGASYLEFDQSEEARSLLLDNFTLAHSTRPLCYAHFGYMAPPSPNMIYGSWNLRYDYATAPPKWDAFVEASQW